MAIVSQGAVWLTVLLPAALLLRVAIWNGGDDERLEDGALRTATVLEQAAIDSFVYLVHQRNAGDLLGPQLGWYTRGWMYGWRAPKSYQPVGIPEYEFSAEALAQTERFPQQFLVYYYSPLQPELSTRVMQHLAGTRPEVMRSKRYVLFGPQYQ